MKPLPIVIIAAAIFGIAIVIFFATRKPVNAGLRDMGKDIQRGSRDAYNGTKDAAEDAKDAVKDAVK